MFRGSAGVPPVLAGILPASRTVVIANPPRIRACTAKFTALPRKLALYVGVWGQISRLTSIAYPDLSTEQTIYNRRDVEWKKDRQNRWTHYLHDQLGRLVYVVDPAGNATQYQYCPCGTLTGIVDPKGNTTSFVLDVQSRVTKKVYADGSTINYNYAPAISRLQSVTDAKGQTTNYNYNVDNTLAGVTYSGTVSTPSVTYTYDPVYPRLAGMADTSLSGSSAYNYNPSSVTGTLGGGMLSSIVNTGPCPYTLTYGYDSLGHVTSRTIVNSGTDTETTLYDGLGRVTQVRNALGAFNYTPYNATNMIAEVADLTPTGQTVLTSTYAYFTAGTSDERLQTITNSGSSGGIISQFTYAYSPPGDITSWTQQAGSNTPVVYGYGYDGADELLSAVKTSSTGGPALDTYGYRYDPAGNRLGQQMALSGTDFVTSATYNDLNQVTNISGASGLELAISGSLSEPGTVAIGSTVVSTDSNYNFTLVVPVTTGSNNKTITATASGTAAAQTTGTLGFNVAGGTVMSPLAYDANGNLTTNGTTNYVYDAANRLVQIWYGPIGSSANTAFTYDGLGRKVQILETSSSGTVTSTKNLIWDGINMREELNASNAATKMYFDNGVQISGTNYYYTRDHLGSIREVTGTSGDVEARYDYDPYGTQTQVSGTLTVDFGYTGLYIHQPSGLLFAAYRQYIPPLGRWISRDPIAEEGGINLYGYVGNNPIGIFDPLGLYAADDGYSNGSEWYSFHLNQGVNPNALIGQRVEDVNDPNHTMQCAGTAQFLTGQPGSGGEYHDAPKAATWVQGPQLTSATPVGTMVATGWDSSGSYPNQSNSPNNHTGIFMGMNSNGTANILSASTGSPINNSQYANPGNWNTVLSDQQTDPEASGEALKAKCK